MIRKWLTVLSLVGLLLTLLSWGASYCVDVQLVATASGPSLHLHTGVFTVGWANAPPEQPLPVNLGVGSYRFHGVHMETQNGVLTRSTAQTVTLGTGLSVNRPSTFTTAWLPRFDNSNVVGFVAIPLWLPTIFIALMFWLCGSGHRRKRRMLGLCLRCGYDLRGSIHRCPECGTPLL